MSDQKPCELCPYPRVPGGRYCEQHHYEMKQKMAKEGYLQRTVPLPKWRGMDARESRIETHDGLLSG